MLIKFIISLNTLFLINYTSVQTVNHTSFSKFSYSQLYLTPKVIQWGILISSYLLIIGCFIFTGKVFFKLSTAKQQAIIDGIEKNNIVPFFSMIQFYKTVFLLCFYSNITLK